MKEDEDWIAPWRDPWTGKQDFTFDPDFSGLDPDTGKPWSPKKVVELLGMKKASTDLVEAACQKVVQSNPKQVENYRAGKKNLLGFFIKAVMDETNKQADGKTTKEILERLLEEK